MGNVCKNWLLFIPTFGQTVCDALVVSQLAFSFNDLSSNPTEVYFGIMLLEKNENKQKRRGQGWPY